jgi:hypothetical protein
MGDEGGAGYTGARLALQRVATHVLARARHRAEGRLGLRVTPGGLATPAFGPDSRVLRIAAGVLVRESQEEGAARSRALPMAGSSISALAAMAGVDLTEPFSAGGDTPPLGDPDAPISLDQAKADEVTEWLGLGARALDRVLAGAEEPSVVQLWPEHFDVGFDAATPAGRVTLGASPGDDAHLEPYLYVSPWDGVPPGDPGFWNAPFGALAGRGWVDGAPDALTAAVTFFSEGLERLG